MPGNGVIQYSVDGARSENGRVHRGLAAGLRGLLIAVAAAAGTVCPLVAQAQQGDSGRVRVTTEPATATTRPGARRAEDARIERTVPLYVGESRLIDAPWPVARVSVNNPSVADIDIISPQQVQLHGISAGITDFTMWSKDDRIWRARVEVELDLRRLEGQLYQIFPRSRLQVAQVGEVVVISGQLLRVEQAAQLRAFLTSSKLNYLDMTTVAGLQQVQLKVRVAEVSRTALRTLSSDYAFGDFSTSVAVNNAASGTFSPTTPIGNLERSLPGGTTLFGTGTVDEYVFEYFIQALADNQYLRLLAEPTLVAYSGEEANFLAGGEFPVPVAQVGGGGGEGNTQISIEYREFGVRLRFRPLVQGDGTIRMTCEPEVSELSDVGAVEVLGTRVPSLLTRRISTTFEMQTGQTFALAGLINQSRNARVQRIPGLSLLPVIGALFRSVRYNQNETEMVVLVTASLVQPQSVPMEDVPLPGVTHRPPSSWELFVDGKMEGKAESKLPPPAQERLQELRLNKLHGPGAWASYEKEPRDTAATRRQ